MEPDRRTVAPSQCREELYQGSWCECPAIPGAPVFPSQCKHLRPDRRLAQQIACNQDASSARPTRAPYGWNPNRWSLAWLKTRIPVKTELLDGKHPMRSRHGLWDC